MVGQRLGAFYLEAEHAKLMHVTYLMSLINRIYSVIGTNDACLHDLAKF
jgi:hypothetical protein